MVSVRHGLCTWQWMEALTSRTSPAQRVLCPGPLPSPRCGPPTSIPSPVQRVLRPAIALYRRHDERCESGDLHLLRRVDAQHRKSGSQRSCCGVAQGEPLFAQSSFGGQDRTGVIERGQALSEIEEVDAQTMRLE